MHQQHVAGIEIGHQVLGAAAETGHRAPLQPRGEIGLERKAQAGAAGLSAFDARALHRRLQAAAHGFDLGQFRHGCRPPYPAAIVSARWNAGRATQRSR